LKTGRQDAILPYTSVVVHHAVFDVFAVFAPVAVFSALNAKVNAETEDQEEHGIGEVDAWI
jgi:hypothetical protein